MSQTQLERWGAACADATIWRDLQVEAPARHRAKRRFSRKLHALAPDDALLRLRLHLMAVAVADERIAAARAGRPARA